MSNKILGIDISKDISPELLIEQEDVKEHDYIVQRSKSGKISKDISNTVKNGLSSELSSHKSSVMKNNDVKNNERELVSMDLSLENVVNNKELGD